LRGAGHRDAIEHQLAHAERNNVRAAYNFAEHLPERRRMMLAFLVVDSRPRTMSMSLFLILRAMKALRIERRPGSVPRRTLSQWMRHSQTSFLAMANS
jgi:hypothetical protein